MRLTIPCLMTLMLAAAVTAEEFSGNPIPDQMNPVFLSSFMQIDNVSAYQLHTAVDVSANHFRATYPPIPQGSTCKVFLIGPDWVMLQASRRQNGDEVACLIAHILVNDQIEVGQDLEWNNFLGFINHEAHLHFELFLNSNAQFLNQDLRSPRRHALSNVAWNTSDATPPEITQAPTIHEANVGQPTIWQIYAGDLGGGVYIGVGGMQLYIDDAVVDSFDFEGMKSKSGAFPPSAAEFYYSLTPPSGPNNPNTIQYKLSWTAQDDLEHAWRLKWWDDRQNSAEGDPNNPSVMPALVEDFGGDLWVEDGVVRTALRWRIRSAKEVESFSVLRSPEVGGSYSTVNLSPILVLDGQVDFEFVDSLPDGWLTVWYRLAARCRDGSSYESRSTQVGAAPPAFTEIRSYPNPATSLVQVEADVARPATGTVRVYSVQGRQVRTLHDGALRAGKAVWTWDRRNDAGDPVSGGIYLLRMSTEEEVVVHKLVLID